MKEENFKTLMSCITFMVIAVCITFTISWVYTPTDWSITINMDNNTKEVFYLINETQDTQRDTKDDINLIGANNPVTHCNAGNCYTEEEYRKISLK